MSSSSRSLEKYRIPLEEIIRATNNFSSETMIGDGGFGSVHKGQLSERWENRTVAIKRLNPDGYQGSKEFHNELAMVSSFDHQNIIKFVGFCDDADQMIIVYHYASNGSLDHHLQDPEKRRCLTWEQRLKLCLGAARGLEYLHSGLGEHRRVIHRDIKSANILLDDNLDARICDFGLSRFGARNQENTQLLTRIAGTRFYMDPLYAERSRLTKESDVYSFGVVMFEISSGALVYHHRCFGLDTKPQYLIDLVRSYYDDDDEKDGGPSNLIDPFIRGNIDMRSFHMFNSIAHECLNLKLKQRPTMEHIIRNINQALDFQLVYQRCSPLRTRSLESFLIPLEEIKLATQGFNKKKCIGRTLVGNVYKGELHKRWKNPTAITRVYPQCYLGENDFYNQVQLISFFYHQNILHFIGYCDETDERILVHEYAPNGSLGDLLNNRDSRRGLTWLQYLEICIGVARGFQYLQLYLGEDNKVIHGRINSRNIMLNENMEAKISFFGFSKEGNLWTIPEKSDMYLFGMFLFEILNGVLFFREGKDINSESLRGFVSRYHTCGYHKSFDKYLADEIDDHCLKTIIDIAYECIVTDPSVAEILTDMEVLKKNPVARPSIDTVIDRLEYAAKCQASYAAKCQASFAAKCQASFSKGPMYNLWL